MKLIETRRRLLWPTAAATVAIGALASGSGAPFVAFQRTFVNSIASTGMKG